MWKCAHFWVLLVKEVVVDFDLSVGFEVIGQQHDGNRHLVEIINLQKKKEAIIKQNSVSEINPQLTNIILFLQAMKDNWS